MPARQAPSTTPDSAALPLQIVKEAFAVSFLTILFLVKLKLPFRHTFPIYSIEIHLFFPALLSFLWHTRPPTSLFAFSTEKTSHGNQNRFSFIKNTNWWRKIQWSSWKNSRELVFGSPTILLPHAGHGRQPKHPVWRPWMASTRLAILLILFMWHLGWPRIAERLLSIMCSLRRRNEGFPKHCSAQNEPPWGYPMHTFMSDLVFLVLIKGLPSPRASLNGEKNSKNKWNSLKFFRVFYL